MKMSMKKIMLFGVVVMSVIPVFAHADIEVTNRTGSAGTAIIGTSPCSSAAGSSGILQPYGRLNVPQGVINVFCVGTLACVTHLYSTTNCAGKEMATVIINPFQGIVSINNLDKQNFIVSGGGSTLVVNPGEKSLFDRLIHSIF